jgi:protoporphyrinogen oxidase
MTKHKVVILGAGPTGLGCAHRLQELGEKDFKIYERNNYAGGLATTFTDENGFLWDIGGHVQFSHYKYFDDLMVELLPDEWLEHQRESWIWIFNRFVPYPLQNNIHRLPKEIMWECLSGMIDVYRNKNTNLPKNFEQWILQTAGKGVEKYFMYPYNRKVWAHSPRYMNSAWVGERVAVTDLERVFRNILENTDDVSWGPNNTFKFPLYGGTGAIWDALTKKVGMENIELNYEAESVNTETQIVKFANGKEVQYEYLVSTIPLDTLTQNSDLPDELKEVSKKLEHSTVYIVGVGLEGKPKSELADKCWMYFPEDNCPFYRVTLFSKYSPHNVPDITKQFSLMIEVAASEFKTVNEETILEDVIQGLRNTDLINDEQKIVSTWIHKENYGYPTPTTERDIALRSIQPELMKKNILSRGRFGGWKYEVSNQDHSLMQGVEAAEYIKLGIPERTYWYPNIVNGEKPY